MEGGVGSCWNWRPGVEEAVAEELKDAAVKLVCSTLGGQVDLSARRASGVRCVSSGVDLELGDGLGRKLQTQPGFKCLSKNTTGVDAIEAVVVIINSLAGEANGRLLPRPAVDSTRGKSFECGNVATIQRQLADLHGLNGSPEGGVALVQLRAATVSFHRDGLTHRADLQLFVQGTHVARMEIDIGDAEIFEVRSLHHDREASNREERKQRTVLSDC